METNKLNYTIKEVAQMFDINESTLRFWEKEFKILHPQKNINGIRFYRSEDISAVRLIYHLLKEKRMTVAGAKQQIKLNKSNSEHEALVVDKLKNIKKELLQLKEAFDLFSEKHLVK